VGEAVDKTQKTNISLLDNFS
jgi:hypothetical protein